MHRQPSSQKTTMISQRMSVRAETAQRSFGWPDMQTPSPQRDTVGLTHNFPEISPLPQRAPQRNRNLTPILSRTCNPNRHANTNQKNEDWNLDPEKKTLIVGDSNLSNIPSFTQADLQIECYPGAKFQHAAELFKKVEPTTHVETVLLSFGINERSRRSSTTVLKDMERAVAAAKTAFPAAQIIVPLVTFSHRLEQREKRVMCDLNAAITAQNHLPKLREQDFKTGRDNIHWTAETGKKMLDHWLAYVN